MLLQCFKTRWLGRLANENTGSIFVSSKKEIRFNLKIINDYEKI